MNPPDINDRIGFELAGARQQPEGISVLVLTNSEEVARLIGPVLAKRLYPAEHFGPILHVEWINDGTNVGFEVVVQVMPTPLSAVRIGRL